jgi:hypothetical protein
MRENLLCSSFIRHLCHKQQPSIHNERELDVTKVSERPLILLNSTMLSQNRAHGSPVPDPTNQPSKEPLSTSNRASLPHYGSGATKRSPICVASCHGNKARISPHLGGGDWNEEARAGGEVEEDWDLGCGFLRLSSLSRARSALRPPRRRLAGDRMRRWWRRGGKSCWWVGGQHL